MYFKVDHVRDFDLFRKVFGDFSLFIVKSIIVVVLYLPYQITGRQETSVY